MAELLVVSAFFEIALYKLKILKKLRLYALPLLMVLVLVLSIFLLIDELSVIYLLIVLASIYRLVNMARVLKSRIHEKHLKNVSVNTALILGLFQAVLFTADWLMVRFNIDVLPAAVYLQLLLAVVIFGSTLRNLKKTSTSSVNRNYTDKELPTVTVAIPARNETTDLEACLRSVLASDYPKLEVIVLDDCSHKQTAEIIKSFAHDGVRFVQGYPPTDDWLAKNLAYDRLADESRGEYLLFCGVDVRFGSGSVRAIVSEALGRNKKMLSILPYRIDSSIASSLVQPIRYWWELALPRRFFNKPPVLSTCWLINRRSLEKKGGMEAVKRSIVPERYFARELIKSDEYSFLRSSGKMDIKTLKNVNESQRTLERVRYPQLDKKPEYAYFLILVELVGLIGPMVLGLYLLFFGSSMAVYALAAALLLAATNLLIIQATNPKKAIYSLLTYPITVLTDMFLLNLSMYRYEFSVVNWKGRNVCNPVMQVRSKLPDIGPATDKL